MVLSTEYRILIKAVRQKAIGQGNLLLNFLTKPVPALT